MAAPAWSKHPDIFERRHNGPSAAAEVEMLKVCNAASMEVLMNETVPESIRNRPKLKVGEALTETEALAKLYNQVKKNKMHKTYIGMGYYNTITPPAILRNIIQNPGWYTPYTPYQAEISQGRMESLVNYQTMVADLTGMPIAQSSLLVCTQPATNALVVL
jgi:glycine dehydrogenase